ncbi:MAG: phasin family protein [Alphaproteobacteria bacterium]|mgnify:FL=1
MAEKTSAAAAAAQIPGAEAARDAWKTALSMPAALMAEAMRFSAARLNAQADHLAKLAGCGDLNEAAKLQSAFLSSALESYKEEAKVFADRLRQGVPAAPEA